jgi:hypothetical protein
MFWQLLLAVTFSAQKYLYISGKMMKCVADDDQRHAREQKKQKKQKNKKTKKNNFYPKILTFAFLNRFQSYKLILIDNISVIVTLFFISEISQKLKNYESI